MTSQEQVSNNKISSKYPPIAFNFDGFDDNTQPLIEVLGIKLYLDDIIILCLLFLLYEEDVKDDMLFLFLVLLLLS